MEMNYDQAYSTTRVGGRVRRKSWEDTERFVRYDGQKLIDEMGFQWLPRHDDVEADDWDLMP